MKIARLLCALFALSAFVACDDGSLPPGGTYATVTGTVLDSVTKAPIGGATVTVDTVLSVTTDASGKFSFKQVPSGDFDFAVQADGYKAYTSSAHVDPTKATDLTIALVR
jgi:hypothetical protein